MDCARVHFGLDNDKWFTPIGAWHPTIPRVRPGELHPSTRPAGSDAPAAAYTILRPAQPYDLATPGTPRGILDVARAADEGGIYRHSAAFALAASTDGTDVVASLSLRLSADLPGRVRRAWVVYIRRQGEDGAVRWAPNGAALLDAGAPVELRAEEDGRLIEVARVLRLVNIGELTAELRGVPYVPPPPRPGPPRLRCYTCDRVTPFSTKTWRPYTRHKCATTIEGRS